MPAVQFWQADWPDEGAKVPAGHGCSLALPCTQKLPAVQLVQAV